MKYFDWNALKSTKLQVERGICVEDIVAAIDGDKLLDTILHPNQQHYPGQQIFIVEVEEYVFLVPFVEDDEKIFLKTIYPSRKFTMKYKGRRKQ
jgi:hypothetical protein